MRRDWIDKVITRTRTVQLNQFSKLVAILVVVIGLFSSNCKPYTWQKGTAKWWSSNSSEESKERGVFVSYYEALPLEYEDSVLHIKLVFKEVYTEWVHWFEWKDTALTKCLFWQNSETIKDQQLIGVFDSSCVLGCSINGVRPTFGEFSKIINPICDKDNCSKHDFLDSLSFHTYWNSEGSWLTFYFLGRYEYIWHTTGVNALGGEFADTIKIPITSSLYYDEQCGYDHPMHFPFGELVFVRKKSNS